VDPSLEAAQAPQAEVPQAPQLLAFWRSLASSVPELMSSWQLDAHQLELVMLLAAFHCWHFLINGAFQHLGHLLWIAFASHALPRDHQS